MSVIARCGPRTWAIVSVACVIVIVASVVWMVSRLKERGNPAQEKPPIYLCCTECRSVFKVRTRLGGNYPRACEKCDEKAAWLAVRCEDCGEIFPFAPPLDESGSPIQQNPACSKCGNSRYSLYNPEKKE